MLIREDMPLSSSVVNVNSESQKHGFVISASGLMRVSVDCVRCLTSLNNLNFLKGVDQHVMRGVIIYVHICIYIYKYIYLSHHEKLETLFCVDSIQEQIGFPYTLMDLDPLHVSLSSR